MPARSLIYTLPAELRAELDRRLIESEFAGYEAHASWLAERGHPLGIAVVRRYGARLRKHHRRVQFEADVRRAAAKREAGEGA